MDWCCPHSITESSVSAGASLTTFRLGTPLHGWHWCVPLPRRPLITGSDQYLGMLTYYTLGDEGPLLFRGVDSTEAEEFILMIRNRAHAAGKTRDKEWIADQAGICFAGDALRWYESLDDVVQGDWGLLRRALLSRYPKSNSASSQEARYRISPTSLVRNANNNVLSPMVPVPAAAGPTPVFSSTIEHLLASISLSEGRTDAVVPTTQQTNAYIAGENEPSQVAR